MKKERSDRRWKTKFLADKMFSYLNDIMTFVLHIATEPQCSESVRSAACGIVGDLVLSFQGRVKSAVTHIEIQKLMRESSLNEDFSKETKSVAKWALGLSQQ